LLSRTFHIAHLTPAYFAPESYVGGGERYVDYIAQALRRVPGFHQCIFAVGPEDRLFERERVPIRIVRNQSILPGQPNSYSGAFWKELRGFDLAHIHQSLTVFGTYAVAIARSLGVPTVGTDLGGGDNWLMLSGRGVELLDGVVSISNYAAGLLATFFTGPHEVLIGPVDTSRFSPAANSARDRRMVLCVSRIMPHKGIDRVLAALPENLSLTIAGRIYHEPYYDLLRQMAVGKDVRFIVDADDEALLRLYRTSGLFIQASTTQDIYGNLVPKPELMGLTTLEAMACGLPVVVSDAGALPELVPDPRFGRVFEDHNELCAIFRDYARGAWPDPSAEVLARAHVIVTHGMDTIGQRLADFYRSVLAARAETTD
jgi:glycosyltransferase involved in cell wall biosynthesis